MRLPRLRQLIRLTRETFQTSVEICQNVIARVALSGGGRWCPWGTRGDGIATSSRYAVTSHLLWVPPLMSRAQDNNGNDATQAVRKGPLAEHDKERRFRETSESKEATRATNSKQASETQYLAAAANIPPALAPLHQEQGKKKPSSNLEHNLPPLTVQPRPSTQRCKISTGT